MRRLVGYDEAATQLARDIDEQIIQEIFRDAEEFHKQLRYPKRCPRCDGPAYIGLNDVDCFRKCR